MFQICKMMVVVTAACICLTSCGDASRGEVVSTAAGTSVMNPTLGVAAPNALVLTEAMKGKSVSLGVGNTFEVRIATIPTAGFSWQAQDLDTGILMQEGDPVYKADSGPNAAGGITTIRFKVVGRGTTALTLIYANSPGNSLPAIYQDSFGMTIEAK